MLDSSTRSGVNLLKSALVYRDASVSSSENWRALALLGERGGSLSEGFALAAAGLGVCAAYVWHAGRVENPVIDLKLLRIHTFRAGVLGASLFRIGVGAIPFLLPLMLQLSFGLTPFQSGMLTFAARPARSS